MRGFHRLAWRGLRARPLRTILSAIGVALGVAVLSAGLATNAGIDAAVGRSVSATLGRADFQVASFGETGLSPDTLAAIAAIPGVDVAAPAFIRRTYLGADLLGPGPLPAPVAIVGIDPQAEASLHSLTLAEGHALGADPSGGPDAVVTATLAREDELSLGSRVGIQGVDAPVYLRVVGILADDEPWGGASGRAVVTTVPLAQSVFGVDGLTRIDIGLAPGTDPGRVIGALDAAVQDGPYVVSSPADMATAMRASTSDFVATTALISAVALFAGAFLIFNTLSMTVVERVRELGLLRAAGATRGQAASYILVQAAVIGALGTLVGLGLGVALATGIAAWLGSIGSVPLPGPILTPENALGAVAIGLGVTLAASVEPARRAGRIPPVEALKARLDLPSARRARLRWLVAVFAVVGLLGLAVWPAGAGASAVLRALAVYSVLLVASLLVPILLPWLARSAGLPFAMLGRLEERLARASVLRDRARAALTVGALTVGLAMIVALGGVGQHARTAVGAWIDDVVPGDLVLTSIFPRGLDEGLTEVLAGVPGVGTISPMATFDLAIGGTRVDGAVMSGADLLRDGRLRLVEGDRATALTALDRGGAVVVPAGITARDGLSPGSTVDATGADGSTVALRVVGIAERTLPGKAGESWLVGWPDAERLGVAGADAFAVRFAPTATASERQDLADEARTLALEPAPLQRIQGAIGVALDRVFGLFDALSLVAVVVAALGIVNTLTMNVFERVREIGMLRAAGMTRDQVWRSVVVEAGITGLVGAICGVATGSIIGGLMVGLAGGRWDLAVAVPWFAVATTLILGVALAMLAAAYPARLASGISIVRAVGYE